MKSPSLSLRSRCPEYIADFAITYSFIKSMDAVSMIQTKRQNLRPHSNEELQWWIQEYVADRIPDYQMSAWLMAVCWQGMTPEETACLTRCMYQSGRVLKWNSTPHESALLSQSLSPPSLVLADKHSTGGVGDKVSIVLAPLVASLGVGVPMIAGRGLGHTGGTIDKLESISGFQTQLPVSTFQDIVRKVGCAICAATPDLCPADRKLYALRDVTATVSSVPLQTASIVCKKIAEAPHSLVLDVKYGRASFQSDSSQAMILAESMIRTAEANGVSQTSAFLTRMDHPIGQAVGNWWEIKECIHILRGDISRSNHDLVILIVVQAAQMLRQANQYPDRSFDEIVELAYHTLCQGTAFDKFRQMVQAQSGNVDLVDNPESYPMPHFSREILACRQGIVADMDALMIGQAAVSLGAGRSKAGETVDPGAGIWFHVKVADMVQADEVLATVYTNRSSHHLEMAVGIVTKAIEIVEGDKSVGPAPPIISHFATSKDGVRPFAIPKVLFDVQ
jgi:pyrimidine-nucleoside phosphorylase